MTTASRPHYAEALRFLAQEAEEAHLAGDGIRVLHLCRVAFDYLERQSRANALGDLTIEDVRWCFSFALYWAFSDYEFMVIRELLNVIPSREEAQCDRNVFSYVLLLLTNPFSAQQSTELLAIPPAWVTSRSAERADIALLTLAVELTWTHDPFGDTWQDMGRLWHEGSPAGSALAQSLRELLERLRCQTYLTLGRWPKGCGSENMPTHLPPLAEAYRLFTECDWDALDVFIREQVPRVRIEDPSYVPLFRLIHATRIFRNSHEGQLLSLSRFQLSVSRQPMQIYESLRQRTYLDRSLTLARRQSGDGGAADRVATFRLAMGAELSALRAWDLMAWRHAVGEQSQVALELAGHRLDHHADVPFARLGIVNAVRAMWTDEKDSRLRSAVERLDTATIDDREAVVRELLSMHPVEWADAYTALKMFSDAIPEALLPDVATWSADLEITQLRLRSHHLSRLAFWGDILGYVAQPSELVSLLKPALIHTCLIPAAWSEIASTLHYALTKGLLDVAVELITTMLSVEEGMFSDQRWGAVYNACIEREELRERFLPWLRTAAEGDMTRQNHITRMESGFPHGPIDDVLLREWVIRDTSRFAAATNHSRTGSVSFLPGLPEQPFHLVTWTDAQIPFINELVQAVDNANGMPSDKLCLLQILAAIVENGADGVADMLATHANRWLAGSLSYFEPFAKCSSPLSSFTVSMGGPEMLERGLWWLGYALLRRRSEAVREVLTTRVLQKGLSVSSDEADIVFAVMIRLALTAPVPNRLTSMAIIGMSEALTTITAPADLGRLIRTFATLLEDSNCGIAQVGDNDVGKMLLDCWARRLPTMAHASSAEVRIAVARVLRIWSRLPASYSWVSFPQQLAACLEELKSDARARVRWAASHDRENFIDDQ